MNNAQHEVSHTVFNSQNEEERILSLSARLGEVSLPAQTEKQAAQLGPEHFEGRLPLTLAEENRFVELFGYYPNGLGL